MLIEQLPDEWSYADENLAMLIDRLDYYIRSEYSSWTTDPDDPEVKAERALRKRQGIKPPPHPLIPPVAWRPASIAEVRRRIFDAAVALHAAPVKPRQGKKLGSRDLAALLSGG